MQESVALGTTSPRPSDLTTSDALSLCVLYCSPQEHSRSKAAGEVLAQVARLRGAVVREVDGTALGLGPAGLEPEAYPPACAALIELVQAADLLVLCVPVHRNAVSGYAHNLVEFLRNTLDGKSIVVIAAMGSPRAHLAAEGFRAHLSSHYAARVAKPVVVTDDLDDDERFARLEAAMIEVTA